MLPFFLKTKFKSLSEVFHLEHNISKFVTLRVWKIKFESVFVDFITVVFSELVDHQITVMIRYSILRILILI